MRKQSRKFVWIRDTSDIAVMAYVGDKVCAYDYLTKKVQIGWIQSVKKEFIISGVFKITPRPDACILLEYIANVPVRKREVREDFQDEYTRKIQEVGEEAAHALLSPQ